MPGYLPCPSCKSKGGSLPGVQKTSGTTYACFNCFRVWGSMYDYETSVSLAGGFVDDEDNDVNVDSVYITDGGLQNDLDALVRQAKIDALQQVLKNLDILDWNKAGVITVEELQMYLQREINEQKDRKL